MTKEHKDLLIELVKKERVRLTVKSCNWNINDEQMQEILKERESANSLINFLQNDCTSEMLEMLKKLNQVAPNTCRDLNVEDLIARAEGGE